MLVPRPRASVVPVPRIQSCPPQSCSPSTEPPGLCGGCNLLQPEHIPALLHLPRLEAAHSTQQHLLQQPFLQLLQQPWPRQAPALHVQPSSLQGSKRSFCRQKAPPGQMWAYSVGFTLLPHLGGFLGWFLTRREIPAWYQQLKKPSWCPSPRVFPLAWAVLYTSMGYASYLVWKDLGGCGSKAIVPLGLYGAQLALNWAWPPLFFGARSLKLALAELLCLDCVAIGTACAWFSINRLAVLLLLPQLCWLCMATCLCLRLCLRQDSAETLPKSD